MTVGGRRCQKISRRNPTEFQRSAAPPATTSANVRRRVRPTSSLLPRFSPSLSSGVVTFNPYQSLPVTNLALFFLYLCIDRSLDDTQRKTNDSFISTNSTRSSSSDTRWTIYQHANGKNHHPSRRSARFDARGRRRNDSRRACLAVFCQAQEVQG